MSLFNKYRPQIIEDVIGQPQVTDKLEKLLSKPNKPQVFFLFGESGTGKTTTANIIKESFLGDGDENFYQYDMAENSKIEDVRNIQNSLQFKPMFGDYNVVLLDEVHNISKKSFELFLVPTEKEDSHNVYIFSTSEPEKIEEAIKSRGIEFEFKSIPNHVLGPHIMSIAEKEGKPIEKKVAKAILDRAQGNCRRAMSFLEGCIDLDTSDSMIESIGDNSLCDDTEDLKKLFECIVNRSSWAIMCKTLSNVKETPESVRKRGLAWFTNCMLRNYKPDMNSHLSDCIYNFKDSFSVDGKAKLTMACFMCSGG